MDAQAVCLFYNIVFIGKEGGNVLVEGLAKNILMFIANVKGIRSFRIDWKDATKEYKLAIEIGSELVWKDGHTYDRKGNLVPEGYKLQYTPDRLKCRYPQIECRWEAGNNLPFPKLYAFAESWQTKKVSAEITFA